MFSGKSGENTIAFELTARGGGGSQYAIPTDSGKDYNPISYSGGGKGGAGVTDNNRNDENAVPGNSGQDGWVIVEYGEGIE